MVNNEKGTSSNNEDAFYIYVEAQGMLIFSHIEYRSTIIFIPDSIQDGALTAEIFLASDTVNIEQVVINSL